MPCRMHCSARIARPTTLSMPTRAVHVHPDLERRLTGGVGGQHDVLGRDRDPQ